LVIFYLLGKFVADLSDVLIERKLGGAPQTSILLYISRRPSSEPLAELAIHFASRWPCVLDNLSGVARRVFT
jgi:hypothetical protein